MRCLENQQYSRCKDSHFSSKMTLLVAFILAVLHSSASSAPIGAKLVAERRVVVSYIFLSSQWTVKLRTKL